MSDKKQTWSLFSMLLMLFISIVGFSATLQASELSLTEEERDYLVSHPTLTVMNLNTFPPFNFNDDGVPKGYTVDYINLMAKVLGVQVEYVSNKPWHEYLQMLKEGKLDIIPNIAITEERQRFVDFTPFFHVEYISGVAVNSASGISSFSDLKDKVVAITNKTFLHDYLEKHYPDLSLLLTPSTSDSVAAVAEGRADAVIGSLPALNFYKQRDWLSNVHITRIEGFELPEKTRLPMGVTKGNEVLKQLLVKAHDSITYAQTSELKKKWMHFTPHAEMSHQLSEEEKRYLSQKRSLSVCIDPDWMPLDAVEDGQHVGIGADFIARFQKTIGIPVEVYPTLSWAESIAAGVAGQCDFFSLIMNTQERKDYLLFTRPYVNTPLVFATTIEAPYVSDISTVKGKKIGIVKGYAFKETLANSFPNLSFVDVENITDGLNRVRDGELFGYADSLISIGYWIQNSYTGELKVSGEFEASWGLGIGVQKSESMLKGIFDKAINQVSAGERQEIINKWISIRYQKGTDWQVTFLSVAAVVLFFSGLLLWYRRVNDTLRNEIQLRIQAEENALHLAQTDQLTGLLNRHASEPLFQQEMARYRRGGHPVCIVIMDVDHFKSVNDQYGHSVGDEVLKVLSHRLSDIIRENDYLVRWGGEEFLVLAPDTTIAQALQLAEKLRCTVEEISSPELPAFTISAGVAEFHQNQAFTQWYEEADKALYQAKNTGRNKVCPEEGVQVTV